MSKTKSLRLSAQTRHHLREYIVDRSPAGRINTQAEHARNAAAEAIRLHLLGGPEGEQALRNEERELVQRLRELSGRTNVGWQYDNPDSIIETSDVFTVRMATLDGLRSVLQETQDVHRTRVVRYSYRDALKHITLGSPAVIPRGQSLRDLSEEYRDLRPIISVNTSRLAPYLDPNGELYQSYRRADEYMDRTKLQRRAFIEAIDKQLDERCTSTRIACERCPELTPLIMQWQADQLQAQAGAA